MLKKTFKNIKINIFIGIPFILWLCLLLFFIYNDLYLLNKTLTNEWLYIVLWLFIFSLFPNLMIKIITEKLQENQIDEHIKECIINEIKNNEYIKELNKSISWIKKQVQELWSRKITNIKDLKLENKNKDLLDIIDKLNKSNLNIEIFERNRTLHFWLKFDEKNSDKQILICTNLKILLKINKDEIKEKSKFNNYLNEKNLEFFKEKLKIDSYWRTIDTAKDYKWVNLELSDIDLSNDKQKESLEKLINLVIENNKK